MICKVDDGSVDVHVCVTQEVHATEIKDVQDYFRWGEVPLNELKITRLDADEELTIDLDGAKIKHTAHEWGAIYEMCAPCLICQSEW